MTEVPQKSPPSGRRATALVVWGLLLAAGAVGFAGYRFLQTAPSPSAPLASKAPEGAGRRGADRPSQPDARTTPLPPSPGGREMSALRMLEIVLNVANVVVGLVGIYLAVIGMRMSRAAALTQPRPRTDGP